MIYQYLHFQSTIKRRGGVDKELEQTVHFTSGQVDITYRRTETEVKMVCPSFLKAIILVTR